ncbi:fibronectin type III domain-containing protein [Phytohabitans houttuyneae]|uniref:Fibronectin type-III domain-containing protein n=1 Tax=Phytohabitans houttuyneae TaxID=1076126 RepID=A0A6V8KIF3_9ACTN|nr:fibronectin type III domain-containing protein [Phytohabitans houttuyneae]GFJ82241.1 hypothetical protein Phou_064210 [Phytohabitans houttuyneae]
MVRASLTLVLAAAFAVTGGLVAPAGAAVAAPPPAAAAAALTPLPAPGQPAVSELTPTSARLTWTRPAGPVFRYSMKQLVNGEWQGYASMPSTTFVVGGLVPGGTYTFAVYAAPLAFSGYTVSDLSPPVTFTTPLS